MPLENVLHNFNPIESVPDMQQPSIHTIRFERAVPRQVPLWSGLEQQELPCEHDLSADKLFVFLGRWSL